MESSLSQWLVQLTLHNHAASFFENADILIAADCVPFAFAYFHREFLKGRNFIIFCLKLDSDNDEYIEKMTGLLLSHRINSIPSSI